MAEINQKRVEVLHALGFCFGTEHYYRNRSKTFNYTDGVKRFCETAEAYWLLDLVESVVKTKPEMNNNDLINITLKVKEDNTAKITFRQQIKIIHCQKIPFTDCPQGEWKFFYKNKVFFWCDEY